MKILQEKAKTPKNPKINSEKITKATKIMSRQKLSEIKVPIFLTQN